MSFIGGIYIRDANLVRQAQVSIYESLDLTLKFNGAGAWTLDMPDGDKADLLRQVKAGIIVTKPDGTTLLSGNVTSRETTWSSEGESFTCSGVDDNILLDRSDAWPEVTGTFSAQDYDVRTGIAETIMRQYVNLNIGPGAIAARQVTGLTLAADLARGVATTGRARFDKLGDLLRELALFSNGMGFQIVQVGAGLQFQIYVPVDRSTTAKFGREFGNLIGYRLREAAPRANALVVGGGGEGAARVLLRLDDATSIAKWGRIEEFVDRRDTTDTTELNQTLTERMSEMKETSGLEVEPMDTSRLRFGVDYNLGDKVSVVVRGTTKVDILSKVRLKISGSDPEQLIPTVGDQ